MRLLVTESDFLTQTPSGEEEFRAFARAEVALGPEARLRASVGWLDHGFRFPLPAAAAAYDGGPGEYFDQPNQRLDADAHARLTLAPALSLTIGGSLNRNALDRTTWKVDNWRDFDSRTTATGASVGTTWNVAAYAEAQWLAAHWLTVYAGARYDRFTTQGSVAQATPPAFEREYPRRSQDQVSPKLAAVATLAPEATLRLSYGEGFRAPTLLDLYSRAVTPGATAGVPVVTEPSPNLGAERVRSFEIGVDATLPTRTRAAVSLFAQRLGDLIYRQRLTPVLNVVTNAGEARIEGVEVEVAQPLLDGKLRLTATATHLFRYDITRNDAVPASVGKRLTDVPRSLYAIGLEGAAHGWSGSLAWRYASHVFGSGDDQNRNTVQGVFGAYDRYGVVSLKLGRELAPGLVASIAVDNLANAEYFQFYRQPGRSVWLELAWRR
ncbi:MAG TPA: TonB-dependent receptor [Gaiellaceae bacterium]|nr:TonB-dependent receptor [Gaiellaceae bacterium]